MCHRWSLWLFVCAGMLLYGCGRYESRSVPKAARVEPNPLVLRADDFSDDKVEVDAVIRLTNLTQSDIKVRSIAASCSCTTIETPVAGPIPANGFHEIPVRVRLPEIGVKSSSINVKIESEYGMQDVAVTLKLHGRALAAPSLVRVPTDVIMKVDGTGSGSSTLRLHTFEGRGTAPWIEHVVANCAECEVLATGTEQGAAVEPDVFNRTYNFRLLCRMEMPGGDLGGNRCSIVVQDVQHQPIAIIPIRVVRWKPIATSPEAIFVDQNRGTAVAGEIERRIDVLFPDRRFVPTYVDAVSTTSLISLSECVLTGESERRGRFIATITATNDHRDGESSRIEVTASNADGLVVECVIPVVVKAVISSPANQ